MQKQLGDHRDASYQERVSKAFRELETEYKAPLNAISNEEIKRIWNNHRGSVNHAAYILGAFRREYSDVHGAQEAAPELVQRAIDCAVFVIRSIGGVL